MSADLARQLGGLLLPDARGLLRLHLGSRRVLRRHVLDVPLVHLGLQWGNAHVLDNI